MLSFEATFLFLALVTIICGGWAFAVGHHKRLGKPWWHALRPWIPPNELNAREWLTLLTIIAVSMLFVILSVTDWH